MRLVEPAPQPEAEAYVGIDNEGSLHLRPLGRKKAIILS